MTIPRPRTAEKASTRRPALFWGFSPVAGGLVVVVAATLSPVEVGLFVVVVGMG